MNGKLKTILLPVVMLVFAFVFASVLMRLTGNNPLLAFGAMIQGAFGNPSAIINTLNRAVPICICAFAVSFTRECGIFNIGIEGQLMIGALGSTIAGIYITGLPLAVHLPLTLIVGMLFGMIWAALPAAMFIERKVNIIVLFLFMNNIASYILQYFIFGPMKGAGAAMPSTDLIQESARFPYLITSPNKLSTAFFLVFAVAAILYVYIHKTFGGYELRATGKNRVAARYAGIPVKKYMYLSVLGPGALAGLAGSIEIQSKYFRLIDGFSPGYGWDGIPIALLSNGNPVAIILGSILFAAMHVGSSNMQMQAGVSSLIVEVIQGFLVLSVAMERFYRYILSRPGRKKEG